MLQAELLQQIAQLLQLAISGGQQQHVTQAISQFNSTPDADLYYAQLLLNEQASAPVRGMAGLILKNNLRQHGLGPRLVTFLRQCSVLNALGDRDALVRSTVGTLLSAIVRLGRAEWPTLLGELLQLSRAGVVSAMEAIAKACEDGGEEMVAEDALMSELIPALIGLIDGSAATAPVMEVRRSALDTFNLFILHPSSVMEASLPHVLPLLSKLAGEASLQRGVSECLSLLVEAYPEEMEAAMPAVFEFQLQALSSSQEAVLLEACEFWLSAAERDGASHSISPFLHRLFPALLPLLVYGEDDPEIEEAEAEAEAARESAELRPRHHHAQNKGGHEEAGEVAEDEAEDEEEEGEDDEDEYGNWSVRKCAAASLDALALSMEGDTLVQLFLPLLEPFLASNNWLHREAAILALGAVGGGVALQMRPHLTQLIPFLVQQVQQPNNHPLLKAITLWTMARYATGISEQDSALSASVFTAMLQAMSDMHPRVQRAACTAWVAWADRAPEALDAQVIGHFISTLLPLFNLYGKRSQVVALDAVTAIAEGCAEDLATAPLVEELGALLVSKWAEMPVEGSPLLLPLLECLCSLAIAAGSRLGNQAPVLVQRSLFTAEYCLREWQSQGPEEFDEEHWDTLMVALDLLGGLIQGLGQAMLPILSASSFATCLSQCSTLPSADVLQSVFAVLGDCAQAGTVSCLHLDALLSSALSAMDPTPESNSWSAANNAVWSWGELACRHAELVQPYAARIHPELTRLLRGARSQAGTGWAENLAVAWCRTLPLVGSPIALGETDVLFTSLFNLLCTVTDEFERHTSLVPLFQFLLQAKPAIVGKNREAFIKLLNTCRTDTQLQSLLPPLSQQYSL